MGPHGLFWWVGAGVLVIAELMTGTFYLLMIALGFVAGLIAYAFDAPLDLQLAIAAAVAFVALLVLRRVRFSRRRRGLDVSRDPDVNLDIGSTLTVSGWHDGRSRAMYRGAEWDVELAPGEPDDAPLYEITALRGNSLIVAAKKPPRTAGARDA
ncbi:NfeD family protein [Paraburkholderia caballeronis]|uniref:Membrane protein implicated in regulation of membrane protease activity n=1 Tax=Paraburkholderia caballeronis TaxID=416943 RepID=A0A1H7NDS7_9BURK|nr:NfeD family protein [Paraburkholderia caballeronis]PXW26145.1 membrane protein implicated in regulation of membrane protease activity [Paraburkholderia caballeronis]PXX01692.1 membrane protein implicated in regulation of membrane protease activity [Paraburkholderia caballeronis]RAK00849.1 membrane protein implicated in regulation of membrane protease activity [Paraburkholderia caballeronis]TDV20915.1 membrane protein implicated in regulation of membrane protease activity [Paraburkholderia ca